uniref:Uncharacterized protein n=1 Tax=Anguilla anguilla TaxID=7936 RepID=A0A0E9WTK2_ANGAN
MNFYLLFRQQSQYLHGTFSPKAVYFLFFFICIDFSFTVVEQILDLEAKLFLYDLELFKDF